MSTTTSTDFGSILNAAIQGGYVADLAGGTYTITQPIGQQHCGVAKTIVFQLASALLFVFSQSSSFCKNAQ